MPPTSSTSFKQQHKLEKRIEVARQIRQKYPNFIPVIVEKHPESNVPEIKKKKYLVPADIGVGKFLFEIRNYLTLPPSKAIFLFVNDCVLPPTSTTMAQIYEQHKDEDGFLYVTYSGENTFGSLLL
jgi:GABA(A) receptor-associated protein